MIIKGEQITGDLNLKAEVCVIGSGAGGAVVAKELAEAGRDVVVLEQGGHYTKDDFTQREDEMMPLLYEDMGQRATVDQSILILQGRNVGGSTVHNLCYCFRTPEPILEKWRREDGVRDMRRRRPGAVVRARRADAQGEADPAARGQHAQQQDPRGLREARLPRLRHQPQPRELHDQSGFCLLGCPFDAKQSMLITYIPAAVRGRRAHLRQLPGAPHRSPRRAACARVEGEVVDALGRPRHRFTRRGAGGRALRRRDQLAADAAAAAASPTAAGRSGADLHLHPSVLLSGIYDEDIYGYRGIPQSYYVDEFIDLEKDPNSGYILMPVYGFPVMTASQLPGFGRAHCEIMQQLPPHGRHSGADARRVGRRGARRPRRQAGRSPTT